MRGKGKTFLIENREKFHINSIEIEEMKYKDLKIEHMDSSEIDKYEDKGYYWYFLVVYHIPYIVA